MSDLKNQQIQAQKQQNILVQQKAPAQERLQSNMIQQAAQLSTQSSGFFGNFLTIASSKSYQLYLSIFGRYKYKSKNEFTPTQQDKIIDYLEIRYLTIFQQMKEKSAIKFTDFDPQYLSKPIKNMEELKNKILKGRTNLQAAEDSLQRSKNSKLQLIANYLNEQSYEFQRVKYNGICWGLFVGSLINATIYRKGSAIRQMAVFITLGHLFSVMSHKSSKDLYFDAIYPIFREDALVYTEQERQQFKDWKPQGTGVLQE